MSSRGWNRASSASRSSGPLDVQSRERGSIRWRASSCCRGGSGIPFCRASGREEGVAAPLSNRYAPSCRYATPLPAASCESR